MKKNYIKPGIHVHNLNIQMPLALSKDKEENYAGGPTEGQPVTDGTGDGGTSGTGGFVDGAKGSFFEYGYDSDF